MDTTAFLDHLRSLAFFQGQIVHVEKLPFREAKYGDLDRPLPPELQDRLNSAGISRLFIHQARAINVARQGGNVMVATPSASGKTLCYNLPVLESLLQDPSSRALYLFPTKALAQDQLRSLLQLGGPGILKPGDVATFDGDTPQDQRSLIKKRGRIILSNPDMLHLGILPNFNGWSRLLRNLGYVVLDEAHVYRGVFGSHVACIMRRLRRICAYFGSHPRFITCSATIANPGEHAESLVGVPFNLVDEDGSPYGGKEFVFWNPPVIDEVKNVRRSANSEATPLLTELVTHGIRSLAFAKTRRLVELIYIYVRDRLKEENRSLASRIKPYRAGYLAEDRRQIEKELFRGDLLAAVATTALELGIDIGGLDATVLVGYPGSISSTWQQAGRSGRRGTPSLTFLIGLDNPLDQYFMRNPWDFFRRRFEHALTNMANPHILGAHLLCAAWERPLAAGNEAIFGAGLEAMALELEQKGLLKRKDQKWYVAPGVSYPATRVNIRSVSSASYVIRDAAAHNRVIETVEASVAFSQIHPGAVYLHQGESYLITDLDIPGKTAYARQTDVNYYTHAREITEISISKEWQHKPAGKTEVYLGQAQVKKTVVGFRKKVQFSEETAGDEELDLPTQTFETVALWFDIPDAALKRILQENLDLAGGLHAAEHASIGLLPLFALCDRNDIGGVSTASHWETGKPQIFIYDGYPGGIGIAEKGYELVQELWEATLNLVKSCPCEEGCPSCIQSPKCGNNNEPLDKKAAVILLQGLLGR
ncbi:MAG: DEAD/DEAH box helicase [Chloroflexi bacterium]|nr:DEAD/DEAH box helicase [Chloroflexota bacterium]